MSQQVKAKFVRVATKPGCLMMKIVVEGKEQWADCPQPVYDFAKKAFKEGQEVTLTAAYENNRYNVSRMEGGNAATTQAPANTTSASQASKPAGTSTAPVASKTYGGYGKSPEESERITRLSVLSSVCTALGAIPGQVEVNAIGDVVEELYTRFLNKIKA